MSMIFRFRRINSGLIALMMAGLFSFSVNAETLSFVTFEEDPLVSKVRGKVRGLVVEVVEEIMRRTGIEYSLRLVPPKRSIAIAERTNHHCVFPIDRSQEREALFQWVSPVIISRHAFYSHPESNISLATFTDAKPYSIGSYLGSGVGEYLESMGFTVDFARDNTLNAEKLIKRRVDLWASDTITVGYLSKRTGIKLGEPELVFFSTVRAMGCNLGIAPSTVELLQRVLLAMYKDGTVDEIYQHYNAELLK